MRKKFIIAALLAGVMAATCFTGYTCKGNGEEEKGEQQQQQEQEKPQQGIAKGEEVTAEEWTAAFNETLNVKNCSMLCWERVTATTTGNYKGDNKMPVNLKEVGTAEVNEFFDLDNEVVCGTTLHTDKVSGFSDLYAIDYLDSDLLRQIEIFIDNNWVWDKEDKNESRVSADYRIKSDDTVYYAYSDSGSSWNVSNEERYDEPFYMLNISCSTQKDGEVKPICELYNAFVYSDGVYTADLWMMDEMYTFYVSFKDGYVLSLSFIKTWAKEEDGLTFTFEGEMGIQIYDIGKTTATPAPEALKAVEDYVKEHF